MTPPNAALPDLLPCPFCGSEQVSLSEGETGDGQPWPYVECEDCAATATPDNWNRRATLSPAELGGVEAVAQIELNGLSMSGLAYTKHGLESSLSDGAKLYTQAALNAEYARGRCDGFDAALSTPRAAEAVTVDKAMIERAVNACIQSKGRYSAYHAPETDDEWRTALTASLTPPSAKEE